MGDRMFIRCFCCCFPPMEYLQSIQYSFEMGCTSVSFFLFFLLIAFYFHGYYTNGRIEVLYQRSIEPCVAGISKSKYQKRKALNKQHGMKRLTANEERSLSGIDETNIVKEYEISHSESSLAFPNTTIHSIAPNLKVWVVKYNVDSEPTLKGSR